VAEWLIAASSTVWLKFNIHDLVNMKAIYMHILCNMNATNTAAKWRITGNRKVDFHSSMTCRLSESAVGFM